jgi:hypothetical protein
MFKRLRKMILLHKQQKILTRIKEINDFNLARIKCYHTEDFSIFNEKYPEDSCSIAMYPIDESHLTKIKLDKETIRIHKLLYEDTVRIFEEYEKRKTKENLKKRVKFIEEELIDIKKIIIKE